VASKLQFGDLSMLADATLAALIHEVEPQVMALALAGSNDVLLGRLLDQLPRDVAKKFRDELLQLGPTRLSDVEAAQRAVAAAATQLNSRLEFSQQAA
jgi:flagellar motor switch protein FliG